MGLTLHTDTAHTPDGRRVTFSCEADAPPHQWSWHLRVTGRHAGVGVTVARRGHLDHLIDSQGLKVAEQIVYRGRPLLLAATDGGAGWLVGWRGAFRDVVLGGGAPSPALRDVVALLDLLEVEESPSGVVFRPLAGSGVTLWSLYGIRYVPGAGMVSVYPRAEAPGLVPSGEGKQVAGGRVWSTGLEVDGTVRGRKFVHVGGSGVSAVDDDRGLGPHATDRGLEALVASLRVDWSG